MVDEDGQLILGVDAGGTKTVGLLVGAHGELVARAEAGSGSHINVGIEVVQAAVERIVLDVAGQDGRPIAAACLAMAGVDTPREQETIRRALEPIVKAPRLLICNDSRAALRAGTDDPFGVVVNAGTGSIAMGINRQGQERRAGGWSYYLSDEGSGYYIGTEALRSVFRTADGRAHGMLLAQHLFEYLAVSSSDDLYDYLQHSGFKDDVAGVASLAPEVEKAAQAGDREALRILRLAGRELAGLATAVIDELQMQGEVFQLVMAGSIFRIGHPLTTEFRRKVRQVSSAANVVLLRREPVWGAVRLAIDLLGLPATSSQGVVSEEEVPSVVGRCGSPVGA